MKEMWNARYSAETYAYGTAPNAFLKESLANFPVTGKMLFAAEGEGRNAVYAASQGISAYAFDISEAGKAKAEMLAQKMGVSLKYEVGAFENLELNAEQFDAAALIFAHFPPPLLAPYHQRIGQLLKPGGLVMVEAFSKGNLPYREKSPAIGGPPNTEMLFSTEMMEEHFAGFEVLQLEDVEVTLSEGQFHNGTGKVIRFVGRKP
ncbi:MAG TPA: SAM-dependent methyltransferase [Cytophagales bacterium]|nr:SAM-dependent methyltransferase [Cytophagales bacterium]HAA20409.1 SAM-dependent methyltransferase [Cytophagales bacterium]HAP58550.1 SAM-dependent methyltransferase [Cytophagales bacterium]